MTPPRETLHAETETWLRNKRDTTTGGERSKRILAYAAECVRKRAELEAEVERLREDAELMRWLFDEMGGGFTHDEEKYGMSNSAWGDWPDDWRDALRKARAAYAQATGRTDA